MSDFTTYYLEQFNYTEEQKKKISDLVSWLNQQSVKFNCPDLFTNFSPSMLDDLSISHLWELSQYKTVLNQMEDIHHKTMRSIEYKTIESFIKLIPEKIEYYNTHLPIMENAFRSKYSLVASDNEIFQNLYSYQEFKDQFISLLKKDAVSINKLNELKIMDLFEFCRQNIMQTKVDLETSFTDGKEILLSDLKPYEKLYNLIASEFFHQYTKESLSISQFSGKHLICELIRPSHPLAKNFNLEVHESTLLSVSLNPIPDPKLQVGDIMSYFDLMFELKDSGEAYKIDIFWPLVLSSKTYYIKAPVYFNHYRLQLINGQRSWRKSG